MIILTFFALSCMFMSSFVEINRFNVVSDSSFHLTRANEIYQNDVIKSRIEFMEESLDADQKWWAKKRAGMQAELAKELETERQRHTLPTIQTGRSPTSSTSDILARFGTNRSFAQRTSNHRNSSPKRT